MKITIKIIIALVVIVTKLIGDIGVLRLDSGS